MDNSTTQQEHSYSEKAWIKGGIFALIVVVLLIIKATFSVLLLILAGILIAVFFHGRSGLICSKTHWKRGICTTISVIGTIA